MSQRYACHPSRTRPAVHVTLFTVLILGVFLGWARYDSLSYCQKAEWHFWNTETARDCYERAAAERAALAPYIASAKIRGFRGDDAIEVARAEKAACERFGDACEPKSRP